MVQESSQMSPLSFTGVCACVRSPLDRFHFPPCAPVEKKRHLEVEKREASSMFATACMVHGITRCTNHGSKSAVGSAPHVSRRLANFFSLNSRSLGLTLSQWHATHHNTVLSPALVRCVTCFGEEESSEGSARVCVTLYFSFHRHAERCGWRDGDSRG